LQRYAETMRLGQVTLSPDACAALLAYEWPGNIRELENVIHYALIVCHSGQVCAADLSLPGSFHRLTPPHAVRADTSPSAPFEQLAALVATLIQEGEEDLYEKVERTLVQSAYDRCDHNQVHTARVLGISRNVVRTQLKRFGLISGDAEPAIPVPETSD
jgi:sigma-54-specific transcriptional regulator